MAKIADLQIDTIKIKNGTLTDWFYPSGSTITVTNDSASPTLIWITHSGSCTLTRNRDSSVIYSGTDTPAAILTIDADPQFNETYTITGGTITGAKVRKR